MTDKNTILEINDTFVTKVDFTGVRGWENVELYVKLMDFSEYLAYGESAKNDDRFDIHRRLVFALCDADGKLTFTPDELPELRKKNYLAIGRMQDALVKLEDNEVKENPKS